MNLLKFILLSILVLSVSSEKDETGEWNEEFTEALLLRPLPDRKVLAHFHFQSSVPPTQIYGRHHHIFPKSIYQLVHKFQIREMELSFTQGRWNYERWGGHDPISSSDAKPPGVELRADFDVPGHQVDDSWKNLTHALSGLFCASINFLEHSTSYSAPQWSFPSFSGKLRYGTLPREAVCTENLTPWLKLLPCRDKDGLSTLMDRPTIYRGYYHSQRLHLRLDGIDPSNLDSGIVLQQTLTVVLQPSALRVGETLSSKSQPHWSLKSLFGKKVHGKCSLSKSSHVYIQFEQNLVSELKNSLKDNDIFEQKILTHDSPMFEISSSPRQIIQGLENMEKDGSILYEFPVEDYHKSQPFDLGLKWKKPVVWSCKQGPLRANRFLLGSGNERGAIAITLKSTRKNSEQSSSHNEKECLLRVDVFQVVPWYVKVYYHTLKVFVDGELQSAMDKIEKLHISPSEDKISPGLMEMVLKLPCSMKTAALTLEFDKGFLHIDEYPPDANQGFDLPSAIVSFIDFQINTSFDDEYSKTIPILAKLQERSSVFSYTEVLLVPLTTPDFSMPYNVITITCTVFALYFGSLLNALRIRVGEEERRLKNKASAKAGPLTSTLSKLYARLRGKPWMPSPSQSSSSQSNTSYKLIAKVLLVAGVAVAWQYFSD